MLEQLVAVPKQVWLGVAVADAHRKMGISEQTFYHWLQPTASSRWARSAVMDLVRGSH